MGRLIASITDDSVGWHDTVSGTSDADEVLQKYGQKTYQDAHNDWHRNGAECFLIELAKWDLSEKDWMPNVNFFSKVVSNEEGKLTFVEENAQAGDYVSIRLEMDALVVFNTCQHPLNLDPTYRQHEVLLEVYQGENVSDDDNSILTHPENIRAFENTENYHKLKY